MNVSLIKRRRELKAVDRWLREGKKGPAPHVVKQANLRELQRHFSVATLIETGTFRGDMMVAMSPYFERLHSVELSPVLCDYARKRCRSLGLDNVLITSGASEQCLAEIASLYSGVVIFWLDGHYSGHDTAKGATECPIPTELEIVLQQKQIVPVIVIDDAREFSGKRSYPTIAEVIKLISAGTHRMHVSVRDDAIVAVPEQLLTRRSS